MFNKEITKEDIMFNKEMDKRVLDLESNNKILRNRVDNLEDELISRKVINNHFWGNPIQAIDLVTLCEDIELIKDYLGIEKKFRGSEMVKKS